VTVLDGDTKAQQRKKFTKKDRPQKRRPLIFLKKMSGLALFGLRSDIWQTGGWS
jgi:hypothetical protein